jgi:molecular chaperone GrpE
MSEIEARKLEASEGIEDRREMDKGQEKEEDRKGADAKSVREGREQKVRRVEDMTKQELLKKLKDTEGQAKQNYDLYIRVYAEMENVKKRVIKEREELRKYANESLIKEILPVIDNLQNAISHAQDDGNWSGLVEGVKLTLDGLMKALEKGGLKEVDAEGKPFDPNFHEAISQPREDKVPPGHVITEFQRGYLLNGRLIRPARVVISQGHANKTEETV